MDFDKEPTPIDLRESLQKYLPVLFDFLSVMDFRPEQWDKLNANFLKRYFARREAYRLNDNHLLISANIYDIITEKLNNNIAGIRYLEFITKTREELSKNLSIAEKKLVNKTLYDFLISYDYRFKNYLGELLVLNSIIKSNSFELVTVETQIVNEQTADFLFSKKDGSGYQLVEVVNLHIDSSHTMLEAHLTKSFSTKLLKKTDVEVLYSKFVLVPVIWADPTHLQRVLKVWQSIDKTAIGDVFEPVSYICLTSAEQVFYKFGTLSTLLKGLDFSS